MNYPSLVDFGLCPVAETTVVTFDLCNTSGNDTTVQIVIPDSCNTLTIEPRSCMIANGKSKTFRASFFPLEAMVLDCRVKVKFSNKEFDIPFKAYGKFPYLKTSSTFINFGEVCLNSNSL